MIDRTSPTWWQEKTLRYRIVTAWHSVSYRLKYLPYRIKYGHWPHEWWDLSCYAARWLAPRLRAFALSHDGYPTDITDDDWTRELNDMAAAFEFFANQRDMILDESDYLSEYKRAIVGVKLFAHRFPVLWD